MKTFLINGKYLRGVQTILHGQNDLRIITGPRPHSPCAPNILIPPHPTNTPHPSPRAENAKIDVKVIGASQEMCNYLPLLQKLPAALVIRKVKVTKHSSFKGRVLLRTTLCAFSGFGKGKIIAHNLGTKIGLISHIYFGIFCTG